MIDTDKTANSLLENAIKNAILNQEEHSRKRNKFINDNHFEWKDEGMEYRKKRKELGLSLNRVGELLGTSATRISNFELGEPISQVNHLKASYNLLFQHLEMKIYLKRFIEMNLNGINATEIIKWSEGDFSGNGN